MTITTHYDFANDIIISNYAYKQCEKYIRSCEAANTNNPHIKGDTSLYDSCVADFDYYIVGVVLSMSENRKQHFEDYVGKAENKQQLNEMCYKWLLYNACYENMTMWILEAFKQAYITKDENHSVWNGFIAWIKQQRNEDGLFVFFADTSSPLTVR